MQRAGRTVLIYLLFSVLFFAGASAVVVTSRAQVAPPPARDLKPIGPDELFTPLPEVTFEGKAPPAAIKVIVLRVPNRDSWNDAPEKDLSSSERVTAGGLELMLEQQIDYRPYFHKEPSRDRQIRYEPMLRNAEVPRVGAKEVMGKQFAAVDLALDTFASQVAFLLSYAPGKGEAPAQAAAFRYQRDVGVQTAVEFEFSKLGKPEADSTVRSLEEKVISLLGRNGEAGAGGNWVEWPFAPVPRLVASDAALREYVNMRAAFYAGELSTAYISYESLMVKDPACGRAALFGSEIYRAVAQTQTDLVENAKLRDKSVQVCRDALKHVPNDVFLRGRLSWLAATHFNRFEFGQAGLKQAMRVQPATVQLYNWWLGAFSVDDRAKQIEWLIENALPLVKDGRIEFEIGTIYYGSGDYAKGVEWYAKAIALSPLEHEWQKSLGLCGTYLAESLFKKGNRPGALDAWIAGTEAMAIAEDLDPREVKYVHEYYVRLATHDFSYLPMAQADLERLFLSQAVLTGLEANARSWEWERLVKDIIVVMQRSLRETCKEAKPGDSLFEMKLMARLQFARVDDDTDDVVHTLWLMRGYGLRTDSYSSLMRTFGPLVAEYEPKQEEVQPD